MPGPRGQDKPHEWIRASSVHSRNGADMMSPAPGNRGGL